MHRTRRLTLFFLFKSHHDYSNLVPRVESFGSPKRGGEGEEGPLSRFSSTREFSSRYGEINSASPLIAPYPPRNTASRDSPLNRDPITLAMPSAGRIFTRLKGYRSACIYIYIYTFFFFHFSFSRRSATVSPPFPLSRTKGRKEGGAKIPISRTYDEPYYALRYLVYSNVSTLSSPPFFPPALLSASYGTESNRYRENTDEADR